MNLPATRAVSDMKDKSVGFGRATVFDVTLTCCCRVDSMMGWIFSGIGRMLPQPVQKQVSRCLLSPLASTYCNSRRRQQTVSEYVFILTMCFFFLVTQDSGSGEVQSSKYDLSNANTHTWTRAWYDHVALTWGCVKSLHVYDTWLSLGVKNDEGSTSSSLR